MYRRKGCVYRAGELPSEGAVPVLKSDVLAVVNAVRWNVQNIGAFILSEVGHYSQ